MSIVSPERAATYVVK